MKTIGAKELQLHLDQVLKGEDIIINHPSKGLVRLTSVQKRATQLGLLSGLHAFDAAPKRKSPFNPKKTIKELYDESVAKIYAN